MFTNFYMYLKDICFIYSTNQKLVTKNILSVECNGLKHRINVVI